MNDSVKRNDSVKDWFIGLLENPLFWTIFSILVGLALRYIAQKIGSTDVGTNLLIGLVGAVITLNVGNLYRHREITNQISKFERLFNEHSGKLDRHHKLKGTLSFLEPAIVDEMLLDVTSNIFESYERIQKLKVTHPECKPIIEWKEQRLFNSLTTQLDELSKRHIVIDHEPKELTANREFLIQLPKAMVCAVSYQDEGFWDEPQGKAFLDAHSEAIKNKGIRISR